MSSVMKESRPAKSVPRLGFLVIVNRSLCQHLHSGGGPYYQTMIALSMPSFSQPQRSFKIQKTTSSTSNIFGMKILMICQAICLVNAGIITFCKPATTACPYDC